MNKKKKVWLTLGIFAIAAPLIGVATYLGIEEQKIHVVNKYKEFINDVINSIESTSNINEEFIKGADVSSYADVIENFLFENNIKKNDEEWYTYKDINNSNIKIWDSSVENNITLLDYINNHLFSYIDGNGNRIYANMFEILKMKGINSLRLKLWVNPYDSNGNQYGGGHNDIETTIFIINEAKKYGFNDFLLDFHYSDFWADPGKQYIPKEWSNLSISELIQKGFDYTYDTLNYIFKNTGIVINRVQYGNEINYGLLWPEGRYRAKNYDFANRFIISSIKGTEKFEQEHNVKIDKSIHFAYGNMKDCINNYKEAIDLCDTIQLSSYVAYGCTFDKFYEELKILKDTLPNKKLVIGEVTIPFTSQEYGFLNDGSAGVVNGKKPDYFDYSPEIQSLIMYQYMQFISKMFPNIETGFYWWEVGYLYTGRSTWATKEGMEYLPDIDKNTHYDISNWAGMTCFDRNGIALPVLDVINNFSRTTKEDDIIYKPNDVINVYENSDNSKNVFYKQINFIYPSSAPKYNLEQICYDKNNANAIDKEYDIEIHLNKYNYSDYLTHYDFNQILEYIVILELKNEFDSIMYDQVEFDNFEYDPDIQEGQITIRAKDNSFYYFGNITFKFKIHNSYYTNTIDLTNQTININKNSNDWFRDIISVINSQQDWAFGKQIYDTLGVSGGANDNNDIWLWDGNKCADRNAEFFLLDSDNIRMYNNKVDYDVLNQHKFWIDNFAEYNSGEHEIFFAIRKGLNDIDWEYNIPSTYSQVGKESWKYVDLLVYKLKIEIN